MSAEGKVIGVNGNMVSVRTEGSIVMNEVGYVVSDDKRLKSEVIRIRGDVAQLQIFELTRGIGIGDEVEFTGEMLAVELGPGLLGRVFDGLQNPLAELARKAGFFLERGIYLDALSREAKWYFKPLVRVGDKVSAGDYLGFVPEGPFEHKVMVPFNIRDKLTVSRVSPEGSYSIAETIIESTDSRGTVIPLSMTFKWPVKRAIDVYEERLKPVEPLVSKVRLMDTFFPVAKGGTYCIPGPFGAGKTVLQQITSRHAEVDVVIIAACGERAGEVVETIKEFPELVDPKTGRFLMERTIIVCNTSSMPVASREASVYTAVTLGE